MAVACEPSRLKPASCLLCPPMPSAIVGVTCTQHAMSLQHLSKFETRTSIVVDDDIAVAVVDDDGRL
eukprot:5132053-Amphidinium_carterae.1